MNLNKKKVILIGFTPVYIILFFMLISMFRTVGVGQVGLVTRFGRVVGEDQSGFHLIAPWPFEGMTGMSIQNQLYVVEAASSTQDLQNVNVEGALNYNLTPTTAGTLFSKVGVNYQANVIDPLLKKDIKGITSQYSASALVDQRPAIEAQMQRKLTADLNKVGVTVDNFAMTNLTFSPQYTSAIENAKVAAENVVTQTNNLAAAKLQAQANQAQVTALTPAILEQQAIAKWNGVLPTTLAAGSSTSPIVNIPLQ